MRMFIAFLWGVMVLVISMRDHSQLPFETKMMMVGITFLLLSLAFKGKT